MRNHLCSSGREGCVLPTGIATDDTTKFFFQDVMDRKSLVSLFDFENRKGLFPAVDSRMKFCLFTCGSPMRPAATSSEFVFFAHHVEDLKDPQRRFELSAEDIALLNPTTRTCPVIASRKDAEILTRVHTNVPTVGKQKGDKEWSIEIFQKMIDVTIHASLCSFTADPPNTEWLPVYEGRTLRHYNHRATTYDGVSEYDRQKGNARELTAAELNNPSTVFRPSCWIRPTTFAERLGGRACRFKWFPSIRYVTNTTNERTVIAGVRPFLPSNNKLSTLFLNGSASAQGCFVANFSSLAFDYVARQKVGGTTLGGYIVEQLPVLLASTYAQPCPWATDAATLLAWLLPRVLELTYTAWDLEPFAVDCGWSGPPFRWDEERRFPLRCELDAAFFHLYGLNRDDTAYILGTFPIVKRKDEEKFGDYRTKLVILKIYDAMKSAMDSGQPYQTLLNPPPADPRCCHPARSTAAPPGRHEIQQS